MNLLKQTIQRIKASLFLQNVASLSSGTTLAQIVSVSTAPVLYRIYDKEDYGTLGLYAAIVGIIGVFSTMQYNHAVLLEQEDEDAKVVMWLNRLINIAVALISLLLVFLFGESIASILGNERIAPWLYLAPVSIFFSGQGQIFSVWANRKKKYRILSLNTILTALLVPVVSISIGVFNSGPFGLFMGLVVSQVLPSIILLYLLTKKEDLGLKFLQKDSLKIMAKKHSKLPIYSVPSTLISVVSHKLPVFFLSMTFGPALVGVYNLCVRMLGLPTQLIGNALSTVFRQRASEEFNQKGEFKGIFSKTFKSLLIISFPMIIIILLFGPQLFEFAFGKTWIESGEIARVLIIMFSLRLISSPLSYAYYIRNKLSENTLLHGYILISTIVVFMIADSMSLEYIDTLLIYALNYSLVYIVYLRRSFKLAS